MVRPHPRNVVSTLAQQRVTDTLEHRGHGPGFKPESVGASTNLYTGNDRIARATWRG